VINISSVTYNSFGLTDIGKRREENQDAFFIDAEINLYLVADGLGGLVFGKETAEYVVKELSNSIKENLNQEGILNIPEMLGMEINKVDEGVRQTFGDNSATTNVIVLMHDGNIYITHVGDSRAYLCKEGKLRRLTEDHNVANQLVQAGILTKSMAMTHETQSMLTNSVGMMNETEDRIKVTTLNPENDTRFLLCTDGLTGMLTENEIKNILSIEPNAEIAVNMLIEGANNTGGTDNITAVLVDVSVSDDL
jgi:serine/threonine protein phosphatase PrpC